MRALPRSPAHLRESTPERAPLAPLFAAPLFAAPLFATALVCLALSGCGGEDPGPSGDAGGAKVSCPNPDLGAAPSGVATIDVKIAVTVLTDSVQLQGRLLKPAVCTDSAPCPLVVLVQDRETDAFRDYGAPAERLADKAGVVVALFNLPGMGIGGFKAPGTNDYGGTWHQTAVKEVMRLMRERPFVDADKTGYISLGYGLVSTSAALKTFGPNTLKNVRFLIDVEGPVDRCAASQAAEDTQLGIGPGDGPGTSDSACHLDKDGPKASVYPGAGPDTPASVVCAQSAWPITKTGEDCTSDWWATREPARDLRSIPTRYQRLQFHHDHRQPSRWGSRVAISAAAASKACPYFGLNDMPPCQSPLSDADCDQLGSGQSCWLGGQLGTGLAPGTYGGSAWCEVRPDALFAVVLPKYVARMLDTANYPDCK